MMSFCVMETGLGLRGLSALLALWCPRARRALGVIFEALASRGALPGRKRWGM